TGGASRSSVVQQRWSGTLHAKVDKECRRGPWQREGSCRSFSRVNRRNAVYVFFPRFQAEISLRVLPWPVRRGPLLPSEASRLGRAWMVRYSLVDSIGIISINNPPVNALSSTVRAGLIEALASARADASRAVLLVCEGSTFIAGADIGELGKPPQAPALSEVLATLEDFPKLV